MVEFVVVVDLFVVFGMLLVGYYDLCIVELLILVVFIVFCLIDVNELVYNLFWVFILMLVIEDWWYFDVDLCI